MESANFQAANMENIPHDRSENAQHLTDSSVSEADKQVNFNYDSRRKCTHCGNVADHRPRTPKCPAFHKTCSQFGIQHHFGRVCMKKIPTTCPQEQKTAHPKVKCVYDYNDDDGCAFQVSPTQAKADITVNIEGAPVQVCIDSGATANTIDYATYEAISAVKALPLKPTDVRLHPSGEDNPAPIPLTGSFFGLVTSPSGQMTEPIR